ncbi:eukaryotic translation initiation factor NCBP-like [Primulina tabacum]|uniref:eukaryotic translation initiation factor NCBP-like n=1 Tax=Primulina tabacum TaxID=48773 RepID=UPI003F5A75BB
MKKSGWASSSTGPSCEPKQLSILYERPTDEVSLPHSSSSSFPLPIRKQQGEQVQLAAAYRKQDNYSMHLPPPAADLDLERAAMELHPLKHKFVFWYTRLTPGVRSQTAYEDNIKKVVDFSTVEYFWVCYCHLARPSTLPSPTDLHLIKDGIRPLWEDSANCNGGKWIIRFKKAVSGLFWEDLVLALIGDQLDYGDNICGAVLSIRFNEDILSVWNRNASDNQAVMGLRDSIKRHLKIPHTYVMEYKPHDASLRDHSSYRNTWLRG